MSTIFIKDSLRASVEAATGGKVTVLYDDKGYPSYMNIIPKFNLEDIDPDLGTGVHPAFIVGGVEKSELFIGQYPAKILDSRACSVPGVDPSASINFDTARAACTAKGAGWHMMTMFERAAIVLWCLKNGFQPRGNTQWGKAYDAAFETGVRGDGLAPGIASGIGRTDTGSGPASWRHDNTFAGIADLVGNVWEWMDLFKIQDGQILCPNDNNYALAEADWTAQPAYFDASAASSSITTSSVIGTDILSDAIVNHSGPVGNNGNYNTTSDAAWRSMVVKATWDAPLLMKQLLIAPSKSDGTSQTQLAINALTKGAVYCRNYGERMPVVGGCWYSTSNAGVGALDLNYARSSVGSNIGVRPAFLG